MRIDYNEVITEEDVEKSRYAHHKVIKKERSKKVAVCNDHHQVITKEGVEKKG